MAENPDPVQYLLGLINFLCMVLNCCLFGSLIEIDEDAESSLVSHSVIYTIPGDTIIYTNLWSTGRDSAVWSNPNKFIPDRFLVRSTEDNDKPISVDSSSVVWPITTNDRLKPTNQTVDTNNISSAVTESSSSDKRSKSGRCTVNRKLAEHCCSFGTGRRRCVGEQLGRMQVFLFFATVMRRCRVLPGPVMSSASVAFFARLA